MTRKQLLYVTSCAALIVVASLQLCARPDSFEGHCIAVRDGDSLEVLTGTRTLQIRLHGIDSPERGQPFSNVARRRTTELAQGRRVRVEVRDRDRYGRLVARVFVDDQDLSLQLVREGLAWHYTRYSSDPRLESGERQARSEKKGLWREPDPVPPWEFRRARREAA